MEEWGAWLTDAVALQVDELEGAARGHFERFCGAVCVCVWKWLVAWRGEGVWKRAGAVVVGALATKVQLLSSSVLLRAPDADLSTSTPRSFILLALSQPHTSLTTLSSSLLPKSCL